MSFIPSIEIFRHRAYRQYWLMRQIAAGARQMLTVAIGWQVYDLARETRSVEESAFLLGMVGLIQFAPVFAFSLIGGQAADRFDRKAILLWSNAARLGAIGLLLYASNLAAAAALPLIFTAAGAMGAVNAFFPAASNSLYPRLVPQAELPKAIAWNSLGYQSGAVIGPAAGGFVYMGGPGLVYGVAAVMIVLSIIIFLPAKTPSHEPGKAAQRGIAMIIDGLRYVRSNRIVLGAITLDFVVVFFGGVTALLPVFARDILHVGAEGLGALRAAPAVGAVIVAIILAQRPLARRTGVFMLTAVALFGAGLLGFAFSRIFWLSAGLLAITGAADMISVYVRQSLIQLATPDVMRGRVSSVSFIFISASNELGEFESGVAARFLGPVGAVVFGGVAAIIAAGVWPRLFPALSTADRFEDATVDPPPPSDDRWDRGARRSL